MIAPVLASFALGFLGSLHCIGMCGGLVTTLSMSRPRVWWSGLFAYQIGRISTYTLMGLFSGLLGAVLSRVFWFDHAQIALTLLAGAMMITFALHIAGWLPDPFLKGATRLFNVTGISRLLSAASASPHAASWYVVGVLNGFLPCGLVYAALSLSLTAGHVGLAALMMLAFGLGTVPAMSFVPALMKSIAPAMRGQVLNIAAVLLIGLGVLTMIRGSEWMHMLMHHDMAGMDGNGMMGLVQQNGQMCTQSITQDHQPIVNGSLP
jgi:sulfite exporter TauE/SafE